MAENVINEPLKVKLSLGSKALERLLGGDSELETSLRHQVAKNFAEKHLKDIVVKNINNEVSKIYKDIEEEVKKQLKEKVGYADYGWNSNYLSSKLKPEITKLIEQEALQAVKKVIDAAIKAHLEFYETRWQQYLDDSVKRAFDRKIKQEVEKGIETRLKAALETR